MRTAIIYSHRATKTSQAAKAIKAQADWKDIEDIDIDSLNPDQLKDYDLLILGAPTWFDGELPYYWDELVPAIEDLNLSGKRVAIFGNGDQKGYPENFGDAVGILAEVFAAAGATIVGHSSTEGYTFEASRALKDGKFMGLILDFENQHKEIKQRVKHWVDALK